MTTRLPSWIHHFLIPSLLMLLCPPAVFLFWYTAAHLGGSFGQLFSLFTSEGFFSVLWMVWAPVFFGSKAAWKILLLFSSFQLLLMKVVPGRRFEGPITPKGNIPVYKANGPSCFFITLTSFFLGSFYFKLFSPTIIFDHMGELLGALNFFSLLFCLFLYFKGKVFPSSSDSGSSGFFLFDYYWGTELYPKIFGWDVKMFTNCRFGMMSWSLILLSYAAKQEQLYGLSDAMLVSVLLQIIYIAKFFFWETGYLRSLDIMHDRAGFMICWGCLVWVPCIYTSASLYLLHNPIHLGTFLSTSIFLLGSFFIFVNYLADRQRQQVRKKNGDCLVFRSKPKLIEASYITTSGETKTTLLLASGWWGLSRHFHYIPEIFASFFWSLPALFSHFFPYFYVVYLTILLIDRAFRHEARCLEKYGKSWETYCKEVPYKIIPFIY